MGITVSPPKPARVASPQKGNQRHDLQQQAGVTRQRDPGSKQAQRDRLRQSQADVQSDAI